MLPSLVDLVLSRSEVMPEETAYTFLSDTADAELTYGDLHRRAAGLAAAIRETGNRGDRVLLLLQPGIDYIVAVFACFHAGRIAVPAYPPHAARPGRSLPRLEAMCIDAEASLAVADVELATLVAAHHDDAPRLAALRWLSPHDERTDGAGAPTPFDIAVLQYTSGSTSAPKAVMIGHDNFLHNLGLIQTKLAQSSATRGVFWLPPYHDMGLVGGLFEPLFAGYPSVLMAPARFIAKPIRWLEAIDRFGGTTSGGPNFAYDLCVDRIAPDERTRLDLSSWSVAFNGAEPVRAETFERFAAAFAPSGFRKSAFMTCYGLAEATLIVASEAIEREPVIHHIDRDGLGRDRIEPGVTLQPSCGHVADGVQVRIVDPVHGTVRPPCAVGEIWVAGPSVARGYWRQPGHPSFGATLAGEPGLSFLRTGDLGAEVDGQLIVTGRLKDLIILHGRNIYPQDIEAAASGADAALGGAAAFAEDEAEDAAIVVVCETRRGFQGFETDRIARAVRRAVADQCKVAVAAVVVVKPGALPKTTSGKIRRKACRAELAAGRLDVIGQSRSSARTVVGPTREVILAADDLSRPALIHDLILALAAARGATDDEAVSLLDLAADSLAALEIATDLQGALSIDVDLTDVLGDIAIADLARRLAERMAHTSIPAAPPSIEHALSPGQLALWMSQRLSPASVANNLTVALRLSGGLDPTRLERAIASVASRHRQLRIAISLHDGEPRTKPTAPPVLEIIAAGDTAAADAAVSRLAATPFALDRGPLWRVAWIAASAPILVMSAHHIIADYPSLQIILDDLEQALLGRPLSPDGPHYGDLIAHQIANLSEAARMTRRAVWRQTLSDAPLLDLGSTTTRRSDARRGTQHEIVFSKSTAEALKALARAERTTLHAVLLAGLHALLHRWTGQDDVVIGTPVTSRRLAWTRHLVGYCVNTLPVRAHPQSDLPFSTLLREVRDHVITGIAHELPFSEVVETGMGARVAGRTPVFQALFALETGRDGGVLIPNGRRFPFAGLEAEPLLVRAPEAAFDLTVLVEDTRGGLAAKFQLAADLLEPGCDARLADQWVRLLEAVVLDPSQAIGHIPLLDAEERAFLIHGVNATAAPMPCTCLHELVAEQAARTPDATALMYGTTHWSYAELLGQAASLAHDLHARKLGPDARIGLYIDRCPTAIVAILGILGAGAAYVYLDPRYPRDRLDFMIADAGVAAIVTSAAMRPTMPASAVPVIVPDGARLVGDAPSFPESGVGPHHLAYVIYTSGSTGRPKGVAVEHRNAAALIGWAHGEYDPSVFAGTLAATSFAFDLSIFELFVPLTCGGTIVLADTILDLPQLPARERVTLLNTVPSAMTELIAAGAIPKTVRVVNLAGEPLTESLAAAVHALGHVDALYNLYGPTEDTTYSTFDRVAPGAVPIIGRPLSNRAAYLLDEARQPVPLGVVGEIWLGGAGVTRGYLGLPDLTAERYVERPIPDVEGRLYRTGDLGRRTSDGRIAYLGRRDRQIKLRGFRIELGEIVSVLHQHPAVADAAVLADAEQRLVAYVGAPTGVDVATLRAHLEAALPPYMVPNRIVVASALPMTANGKIDQSALAALDQGRQRATRRPANEIETALLDIWRDLLGVDVAVDDDFFGLGGHSLLAIRLQARILDRFAVDLPLSTVFEQTTVERLAQAIETGTARSPTPRIQAVVRGRGGLCDLVAAKASQ